MIDYHKEAVDLLEELYHTPQDQRIGLLEERLTKAYKDGSENDWWKNIEEEKRLNKEEQDFERVKDLYKKRRWY